jgi:hypothetical protein
VSGVPVKDRFSAWSGCRVGAGRPQLVAVGAAWVELALRPPVPRPVDHGVVGVWVGWPVGGIAGAPGRQGRALRNTRGRPVAVMRRPRLHQECVRRRLVGWSSPPRATGRMSSTSAWLGSVIQLPQIPQVAGSERRMRRRVSLHLRVEPLRCVAAGMGELCLQTGTFTFICPLAFSRVCPCPLWSPARRRS